MYHNYDKKEEQLIVSWLKLSFLRLIERDIELLIPDKIESDYIILGEKEINREVHETAINHRLAVNIEMFTPEGFGHYHVDIEYNRFINQRKMVRSLKTGNVIEVRPDILVHSRTNLRIETPHLLVVEAKKYKNNEKDRNHIFDIMADSNYNYKYGLLVSYYDNSERIQCELISFVKGDFKKLIFDIKKEN